ncbi:MAG: SDR family oxidoreductase [Vicingaceae bacterium]
MNCLLTGASGILGSHILFEWLRKALIEQSVEHLFVVIRDTEKTAEERLVDILQDKSRPEFLKAFPLQAYLEKVSVIAEDLSSLNKQTLEQYDFDTVIHCAGSTSLQQTTQSKDEVYQQNFLVTKQLIDQLPSKANRFLYISTAFSFGIQDQKVSDQMEKHAVSQFRNPYEQSKYECEQHVKESCQAKNINAQILRPSIICGRLLDKPFFETPKYDVFYSWAIFLDKHAKKSLEKFRIWVDKKSGLNIVPVDFVSRAVLHAFSNPKIEELNIVNPKQILHTDYVGEVLEAFNIRSYEYQEQKPENLNPFETLYYKSIGSLFEKYVSVPDLQFQAEEIMKLIDQWQLELTLGVHENFMNLINYSVRQRFKESY